MVLERLEKKTDTACTAVLLLQVPQLAFLLICIYGRRPLARCRDPPRLLKGYCQESVASFWYLS